MASGPENRRGFGIIGEPELLDQTAKTQRYLEIGTHRGLPGRIERQLQDGGGGRDEIVERVVRRHLLVPGELERLGITPPEGILIQRSSFGDGRPTVFAVVKYLPNDYRKVTITYDHREDVSWVTRPDLLVSEAV